MHEAVGFHLKGVEEVTGTLEVTAVAACLQPEDEIFPVEAQPRVVGGAGLVEVYHLMVLHGVPALVEMVGIPLAVCDDGSEERQTLVALRNPEGHADGLHVGRAAGTYRSEQEWYDAEWVHLMDDVRWMM